MDYTQNPSHNLDNKWFRYLTIGTLVHVDMILWEVGKFSEYLF